MEPPSFLQYKVFFHSKKCIAGVKDSSDSCHERQRNVSLMYICTNPLDRISRLHGKLGCFVGTLKLNTKHANCRVHESTYFHFTSRIPSSAGYRSCNLKSIISAFHTALMQREDPASFHVQIRLSKYSGENMRHCFCCTFGIRFHTQGLTLIQQPFPFSISCSHFPPCL